MILIILAAFILIGVFASGGDSDKNKVKDVTPVNTPAADSSTDDADTASAEPQAETAKTDFSVGEVAEYNDVQVSLLSYEESTGNEWGNPEEGNVFIFANVEIVNNTDSEISVSSMLSFDAYCDDYKLSFSSGALMAASVDGRQQLDGSIAPGKKLNGYLGLEVPADWKILEINYKDNVWLDSSFKFIINKE